jgi:hypothetical protein
MLCMAVTSRATIHHRIVRVQTKSVRKTTFHSQMFRSLQSIELRNSRLNAEFGSRAKSKSVAQTPFEYLHSAHASADF